jgi:S-adenosyl-L-methionine hydrolase (adenosine-forming)
MNIITVLTDFGQRDPYVGIVKGVVLAINPGATLIDISHEVAPRDVKEACFLIPEYYPCFPPGTVHLCVVDPTVGSSRKPLVLAKDGHFFVGPDNGLFSLVLEGATAYEIANSRFMLSNISGTFHGRDIFAPAAAHLSCGVRPSEFGPILAETVRLPTLHPLVHGDIMTGEIVRFDRFGNAITNISFAAFTDFVHETQHLVEIGDLSFHGIGNSYYEGEFTCLVGSSGYLECALFQGNLATEKRLSKGDRVIVRRSIG